ncbi:MAG: hypothetical protein D6807_06920 [Alphaproteobacteria bacterium]|nr:MAG: hypothetical protein D6807_06920 [Alphaproteobacteria bacterium]
MTEIVKRKKARDAAALREEERKLEEALKETFPASDALGFGITGIRLAPVARSVETEAAA